VGFTSTTHAVGRAGAVGVGDSLKNLQRNIFAKRVTLFMGKINPVHRVDPCEATRTRGNKLVKQWVPKFVYTLGLLPKTWFLHEDTC
jgi:hypothetical protein